jgi:TRAP-type C4-dicarboxylate transport system permease small subunit
MQGDAGKWIHNLYVRTITIASMVGAVWTFLLMFVIVFDVVGRGFFNIAFVGTAEIVRNSIVGIIFLQMAHVLRMDRHIRTTVILDKVSPKTAKLLEILASICGLVLFVLLFYSEWDPTWNSLRDGEYEGEGALPVPTFPVHLLILIGTFFMIIQFAITLVYHLLSLSDNNNKYSMREKV